MFTNSGELRTYKPEMRHVDKNFYSSSLTYSTNEFKCIAVQFKRIQNLDWFKEVLESLNYFEGGFYNKKNQDVI